MSTYELRTYQAAPGRMPDLLTRFRDHTIGIFTKHGIEGVGYWIAEDDPNRLVYLLRHQGSPEESWERFLSDPRWVEAWAESEKNGALTTSVEAIRLIPAGLINDEPSDDASRQVGDET